LLLLVPVLLVAPVDVVVIVPALVHLFLLKHMLAEGAGAVVA